MKKLLSFGEISHTAKTDAPNTLHDLCLELRQLDSAEAKALAVAIDSWLNRCICDHDGYLPMAPTAEQNRAASDYLASLVFQDKLASMLPAYGYLTIDGERLSIELDRGSLEVDIADGDLPVNCSVDYGLALDINDRGNMTLWHYQGNKRAELWGLV